MSVVEFGGPSVRGDIDVDGNAFDPTSARLTFDDKNRLVLQVWKYKFMAHRYANAGKLSEFSTHHRNGRVTRPIYSYDSEDHLQTVERVDSHSPGKTTKRFLRNADGQKQQMIRTNERGEILEQVTYSYAEVK